MPIFMLLSQFEQQFRLSAGLNEDMYLYIMSKISWPIWIHAHKNVIACQLFSHVMGDVHGGNRDSAGVFMDASAWRL